MFTNPCGGEGDGGIPGEHIHPSLAEDAEIVGCMRKKSVNVKYLRYETIKNSTKNT